LQNLNLCKLPHQSVLVKWSWPRKSEVTLWCLGPASTVTSQHWTWTVIREAANIDSDFFCCHNSDSFR